MPADSPLSGFADAGTEVGSSPAPDMPGVRDVVLFGTLDAAPIRSMERYAETLASGLPAFGWKPRLIHGRVPPFPRNNRFARILAQDLASRVLYARQARREHAEVYHVIDHSLGYLVGALPTAHTVVTCHDLTPLRMPALFGGGPGRALGVQLFRRAVEAMTRAAHVVCVSEFTRQDVVNRLGMAPERTSVIPMGVSETFRAYSPQGRAATRRKLGLPPDACLVLHVGHAGMTKNVETVIRVVAALRARNIPTIFLKVGPVAPNQAALMAETGVQDHFRAVAAPGDEDLRDVYNACDVLLFPSLNEGFGWPPLEAMRCGLPVVVSTAPTLLEITSGFAPAFAPEDVDGMADAVEATWHGRDRRDMDAVPARCHAESFTWRRTIEGIGAVYARLARL